MTATKDISERVDPRRLLAEYAERGTESAFRAVTEAYLGLVYSTALRLAHGDTPLAEDIAQMVFIDLARQAGRLEGEVKLGGWLHRHTCFVAGKTLRTERRRRERERQAAEMNTQPDHSRARLAEAAPALDEAINRLNATDRAAIVSRFYERLDFQGVGESLRMSEAAAQKRVARALEKLRALLAREGVSFSATALGDALWREAVLAPPQELAIGVSTAAVAQAAGSPSASGLVSDLMSGAKGKMAAVAVMAACAAGPIFFEWRAEAAERAQERILRAQAAEISELSADNRRLAGLLENSRKADVSEARQLARLRNKVSGLRSEARKLMTARTAFGAKGSGEDRLTALRELYATQVERLKEWLNAHPSEKIPELEELSEDTWLGAVSTLDQDDNFERAASNLRDNAEWQILERVGGALRRYAQDSGGQFPTDLAQLKPYLGEAVDDAILQRYEIVPTSSLGADLQPGGDWAITQIAGANPALDSRAAVGLTNIVHADERVVDRWKSNP